MTLADRLRSPDAEERRAAIAAVVEAGTADAATLAALGDCLGHARKSVQRPAAEAFATLAARGVAVRAVLQASLAAPLARQRWGAAFALAQTGPLPDEAVPAVLETLGGDDGDMRWAAAGLVVGLKGRPGLEEALCDLARTGHAVARRMALYALRDLGTRSPHAAATAMAALGAPEVEVRLAAVGSLARLATDRGAAAERLVAALEGDDARVRRAAAAALGTLGERSEAVITALDRAAADAADPSLRRAADGALRALRTGAQ